MNFEYLSFEERQPDSQYRELLERILREGVRVQPQQGEPARMVFGHQMRFDLRNGFPIVTERDLVNVEKGRSSIFELALAELCAFLNGARTQEQLSQFGCTWWKPWVTPEKTAKRGLETGDLGPGSYGPAWRNFPTAEGDSFDQITHVIEQIRELPHLRTHIVTPFIPQYLGRGQNKQQQVVVVPCHGFLHFSVFPDQKRISLHHFQRSADVPVGLVANLIQYAALLMMVAQVTKYLPWELVYTISDAHIFHGQLPDVLDLIHGRAQRLPSVYINNEKIDDIFQFRPSHFTVSNYHPQLSRRVIWTPI